MNKKTLLKTLEKRQEFCNKMFQNSEIPSERIAYATKFVYYQKIIDELKNTFLFVFKKQIKPKYFWAVKTASFKTDAAIIIFQKEIEVYDEVLELLF